MNMLETIVAERRKDVAAAKERRPVGDLRKEAEKRKHRSLVERLGRQGGTNIVAELKKASPSAGLLREDYRPGEIAAGYEKAGAAAISVLTEPHRFLGEESHLREVRSAVDIPVLRKDFLVDPYQVVEAAAWGADAVLLIVAAVDGRTLQKLYAEALIVGLDTLVEVHTAEELKAAVELESAVIGVNSRDLKTLRTDLGVARDMAGRLPAGRLAIAESGIRDRAEIEELEKLGYRGFLIGEALMREKDPAVKLRELRG